MSQHAEIDSEFYSLESVEMLPYPPYDRRPASTSDFLDVGLFGSTTPFGMGSYSTPISFGTPTDFSQIASSGLFEFRAATPIGSEYCSFLPMSLNESPGQTESVETPKRISLRKSTRAKRQIESDSDSEYIDDGSVSSPAVEASEERRKRSDAAQAGANGRKLGNAWSERE